MPEALSPVTSLPSTVTDPAATLRRPVIASISSVWPLPSMPATPTISPARTPKREAEDLLDAAVVEDVQAVDLEERLRRRRGAFSTATHLAPDHQPGEARLGRPRRRQGLDQLAAPHTVMRSATSVTSLSLWLMKTIDLPCAVGHE